MNRRSAVARELAVLLRVLGDRAQERRRREVEPDERAEEVQHLGDLVGAHHGAHLVGEPQPRGVVGVRRQLEPIAQQRRRARRAGRACRAASRSAAPWNTRHGRAWSRRELAISSLIRRVLPVPWLPTTVTSCGAWKSIARATTSSSVASVSAAADQRARGSRARLRLGVDPHEAAVRGPGSAAAAYRCDARARGRRASPSAGRPRPGDETAPVDTATEVTQPRRSVASVATDCGFGCIVSESGWETTGHLACDGARARCSAGCPTVDLGDTPDGHRPLQPARRADLLPGRHLAEVRATDRHDERLHEGRRLPRPGGRQPPRLQTNPVDFPANYRADARSTSTAARRGEPAPDQAARRDRRPRRRWTSSSRHRGRSAALPRLVQVIARRRLPLAIALALLGVGRPRRRRRVPARDRAEGVGAHRARAELSRGRTSSQRDQVFAVLERGTRDFWFKIELEDGTSGWILGDLVYPFEVGAEREPGRRSRAWAARSSARSSARRRSPYADVGLSFSAGILDREGVFLLRPSWLIDPYWALEGFGGLSPRVGEGHLPRRASASCCGWRRAR